MRLEDHLEFLTSGSRGWSQHVRPTGAMFLRIQNVGLNQLMLDDVAFVDPPSGAEAERTKVRAGDVLLSITADLGRTAVVPDGLGPAHINQHLAILRLRGFEPRFVSAFISLGPGKQQLARLDRVGVKSGLNFDDVRSLQVPLPPLPEQRRIADILDKADAIRRKRKEAIALTEELLRSAFLEMFGVALSNVEDGPLPAGWRRMRVDELKAVGDYTCVGGPFGSNLTSKDYLDEGVPVIRGTNLGAKTNTFIDDDFVFVSQAKAASLVQNMAYPGDLVFTQRGTLGQVALIPLSARYPRYVVSQSQMKLTPNPALVAPIFLHSFFCTERMQRYVASHALTTGVPHINLGILRAMPVLVPPRVMQDKFERVAEASKLVLENQSAARDEAAILFDSLVHRAFRGELTGSNGARKPQLALFGSKEAE